MAPIDILFFDIPISREVPGFLPSYPSAFFPCLGVFHFIDCGIANTMFAGAENRLFFIHKEHVKHLGVYAQAANVPVTPVIMEKEREKSVLDYLAGKKKGKVILYNLSAACLLESRQLLDKAENCGEDIIRISVDYLPSDIYIASADLLLRIINAHPHFMENLFSELLPAYSDQMDEIEGKVIFFSNIANFMNVHLEMINWKNNEKFLENLHEISRLVKQEDASIGESGEVKGSLIFSGTRIEGFVENSFIFPGVHIGEGARISNSIIMNGHKIGKNVSIANTLVFPHFGENLTGVTIGSDSTLGSDLSKVSNRNFPKQISRGLTVIGTNVKIPRKVIVEPGCLIGPTADEGSFRGKAKINKGSTLKSVGDISA